MIKIIIPKGRMFDNVSQLLSDIGISLKGLDRNYRPVANDPELSVKLLKSQNIPSLVSLGQHDCGFAGLDWIKEQKADVEVLLDLKLDPVEIVVCIPEDWNFEEVKRRRVIAVSEYREITQNYLRANNIDFTFLQSYGATEVFPPEDADLIVDNTSSGSTIRANRLKIVDRIMTSATHFIACPASLKDPEKRAKIENIVLLFESVLTGRSRVLLEMNCPETQLEAIVSMLPAMKSPTVSKLYQASGFSVKAAIDKSSVRELIPRLKQAGATDILETSIRKVIP